MKISVVGIGPGHEQYLLPMAQAALRNAEVVIGYSYYFDFIKHLIPENAVCIMEDLGKEEARAQIALERALENKDIVVIGSGDAGIYAMASLVYEVVHDSGEDVALETIPGISAFLAAGSKLGAPLGHDFCCISLSDLMTPWTVIEQRIIAAAMGDFVTNIYNPKSKKRYWQLPALQRIFLKYRDGSTPVAIVRQVGREEEQITHCTLATLKSEMVDMFSLVVIGNSQTYRFKNYLVTPRGYLNRKPDTGEEIQQESFRQIAAQLSSAAWDKDAWWAVVRLIHTTGDFDYPQYFKATSGVIARWNHYLKKGGTIVTDVTMVKSGITRRFVEHHGVQVHCYLNTEEAKELAVQEGITRSQAGIRIAMEKHPDALYVIGNAPTALIEIADAIVLDGFNPEGVVGAPVGFVNVLESKLRLEQCSEVPYVIVKERRGGSNIAAAIVNAAFTLEEADRFYLSVQEEKPLAVITENEI